MSHCNPRQARENALNPTNYWMLFIPDWLKNSLHTLIGSITKERLLKQRITAKLWTFEFFSERNGKKGPDH